MDKWLAESGLITHKLHMMSYSLVNTDSLSPLLGTIYEIDRASDLSLFLCPEQVQHLRAVRQGSKGIRYYGCRGRARVTESSSGHHQNRVLTLIKQPLGLLRWLFYYSRLHTLLHTFPQCCTMRLS